uniref:PH domain-containing protein n=1 Tax=Paramoeba aestuarina TaxID=180227 RepID=A0A7S4U6R0_9EUKA
MYEEVKMELLDEISALEFELQEEREARLAVEKELTETRSRERALLEMKAIADGEVERLRGEVSGLENHLRVTQKQLHAAEEQLDREKERHNKTKNDWETKYNETVTFKDEEMARIKQEHADEIAKMKAEMQRMMEEMKREADAQIAKMQEEKEESINRVEVLAEEKMTVLERTTAKVSKSGYLWKYEEGFMKNTWKKYYFVLKSSFLSWYSDQSCTEKEPVGVIDLESARAYKAPRKEKEKKKYEGCEFEIRSTTRVVNLRVDYARDVDPWVQAISMAKARYLSSGTVNLDKVSVDAVKQGLVGTSTTTKSSTTTTKSTTPRG